MASGVSALFPTREIASARPAADAASVEAGLSAAIAVTDLRVRYKVAEGRYKTILDGLNLQITPGEFVVLLGETGCGKSTLLRLLLGQERPESGTVQVAGRPVEHVDSRSGYVPQRYSLFPNYTVLQNLMIGPEMSRYHLLGRLTPGFRAFRRQLAGEAIEQLRRMGLHENDGAKYPHQLSGGMQQRVAIAQALMMRPRILLMDEAFSALDPGTRGSLQRLLRSVWEETQPTVVFVTHNTAEALFLGTRVVVLTRGAAGEGSAASGISAGEGSTGEEPGARVALDLQLPKGGLTFARDGTTFLQLAEHIEGCSRAPVRNKS